MIKYELTEREVKIIEDLRKREKIDKYKLEKKIDSFLNNLNKLKKSTNELRDIFHANEEANKIIKTKINLVFFEDLYKIFEEFGEE